MGKTQVRGQLRKGEGKKRKEKEKRKRARKREEKKKKPFFSQFRQSPAPANHNGKTLEPCCSYFLFRVIRKEAETTGR